MSSTSRLASSTKPWASGAAGDRDHVGVRRRVVEVLDQPGGHVVLGEHLDHALRRAVAGVHDHDPVALARRQRSMSATRPLDVAAVGVDGRAPAAPARHRAGEHVDVDADHLAQESRSGRRARRASSAMPNGLIVHHGLSCVEACARGRRRGRGTTRRRGRSGRCRRRRPPPSWRPRNSSLVATRSWARLRARSGSSTSTWVSSGIRSTSSSISSTSTGASDSMPSTAMPAAILSVSSSSCGCALAELGRAARVPRR